MDVTRLLRHSDASVSCHPMMWMGDQASETKYFFHCSCVSDLSIIFPQNIRTFNSLTRLS